MQITRGNTHQKCTWQWTWHNAHTKNRFNPAIFSSSHFPRVSGPQERVPHPPRRRHACPERDRCAGRFPPPSEIPELPEIAVDSEGALIAVNIDIADVERDPTLALFEALPPERRFDNENDLDNAAKDALKQWRANRPKKTTSAYAKCKRLWKVSIPPPALN